MGDDTSGGVPKTSTTMVNVKYLDEAEATISRLTRELEEAREALTVATANRIEFTYEPTGERVTVYAPDHRSFEILADYPTILSILNEARKARDAARVLASLEGRE